MGTWMDRYRTDRREAPDPVLRRLGHTGQVRLRPGPFADRIANAVDTYLGLDPDDVLHGFRRQAGMDAPGTGLGGWSSVTSEATFGQWVSGLARLSAALGDGALAERAVHLVEGWAQTIGADGDPGMRSVYGWEKTVCGLVDTALYTGHSESLDILAKMTGHASRTFDRSRVPARPNDFAGDGPGLTLEWYTLAENLHRGYLAGADASVEEFARVWHYDSYWDRFEEPPAPGRPWPVSPWLHAYSHVNTFASAAAAYEVTGEPRLLAILRNAHDYVTQTQCYATGGYGPSEFTMPEDGSLGRSLEWRTDTAEIVCGSWAAFKLCTALLAETGEARYADWIEQLLYSGLGATTPVDLAGRSPYYQDYRLGICTKLPHWDAWPCCSGTYIQCVSQIPDLLYYGDDAGMAVSLYLPSQVTWAQDGRQVTLVQDTAFPEGDSSTLRVQVEAPTAFELRLRVPSWTQGMSVELNGDRVDVPCTPGQWAVLARTWAPGDTVVVRLGAGLRAMPVDAWHPNRVAFAHGPVVLAQDAIWTSPLTTMVPLSSVDLNAVLVRTDEKLHFAANQPGTHRQPTGGFLPLSEVVDRQPHRVYLDVDHARLI